MSHLDQNQIGKEVVKYSALMLIFVGVCLLAIPKAEQAKVEAKAEKELQQEKAAMAEYERQAAEEWRKYEEIKAQHEVSRASNTDYYTQKWLETRRAGQRAEIMHERNNAELKARLDRQCLLGR